MAWAQLRAQGVLVQTVQCSRMSDLLLGKIKVKNELPLLKFPVKHVDIW